MKGKSKASSLSVILGGISALIQSIIFLISGSPFDFAHKISNFDVIPPLWLWCLTLLIMSFLAGYAFGTVFDMVFSGGVCRESEVRIYQGGILFIAALISSFAHYPVFFIEEKIVLALIISIIEFLLYLGCAITWSKANLISCVTITLCAVWAGYVSFVNIYLIFNI